jgi:tryptophanyl-tRNA synthetase
VWRSVVLCFSDVIVCIVLDWLAAGLDPSKSVLFIQSKVPEHAELALLLSMITPLGWLERIPTYKDQKRERIYITRL